MLTEVTSPNVQTLPVNNATCKLRTWLLKIKRKDPPVSKHSYLCSEHFSEDCFMRCVGGKRYLKSGSVPTRFIFSAEEKPKREGPVYHSAGCETTKSRVKLDKVILNSQSNPVDNLAELESVSIPCQDYGFPSVTTDKAEAVKSKEELLMEQLKRKGRRSEALK
ncbi:THAP domain-containing protein 3-like [Montipora foliosa]|uniref:THAP domain-containing protein 3-like n=1 Tax=Montipora foliosa TaxID=591990 RepID=UPI0035F17C4C